MSEQALQKAQGGKLATTGKPTTMDLLKGDAFKERIMNALPKHLAPDRMIAVALTCINKTPKLAQCDQGSFFQAMLSLSQLGLEPDGRRAHLIPYGDHVQLIIDYKGLVELAMRSGQVSNIHADVVCENDVFEYDMGDIKVHKIDFKKERGEMYAAYSICTFKDGTRKCEVMSKAEVDSIRKRSRAGGNGPWVTDFNEMAKKGLAVDTLIPTPDGWKRMGELRVGNVVFDMHGKQTFIIATSDVKHLPCYRITFSNGDSIVCDNEHKWVASVGLNGSADRKANGWKTYGIDALYSAKKCGNIVSVPVALPIDTLDTNLDIEPWILGYWLGNGNSHGPRITCHEDDLDEVKRRIIESQYTLGKIRHDSRAKAVSVGIKGGLLDDLRAYGLIGNKHVPSLYLRGSKDQRLELLRGLMDSDGCIEKARGRAIFASKDVALVDAVAELVASLGDVAHRSSQMAKGYGVVSLSHRVEWKPTVAPVSVYRKLRNFKPRKISAYRGIKSIEKVESVPTMCIAVDSSTKTYLAGETMVPTHNTAFRRLSKWLPLSPELRDAFDKDDDVPRDITNGVRSASPLARIELPESQDMEVKDQPGSAHVADPANKETDTEGAEPSPTDVTY
mgnify:CR=1 FL=1